MRRGVLPEIEDALSGTPFDFGGGCTELKGSVLAQLIREEQAHTIVEVGVLYGRGLIALAVGARGVKGAHVWGLDPFDARAYVDARQDRSDIGDAISEWLHAVDFDAMYA